MGFKWAVFDCWVGAACIGTSLALHDPLPLIIGIFILAIGLVELFWEVKYDGKGRFEETRGNRP